MNEPLGRECDVFVRYLASRPATPYVRQKYAEAVEGLALQEAEGLQAVLLQLGRWSPLATRITDAYAAIFAPRSVLRARLVLALALLECTPPYCDHIDRPSAREGPVELIGAAASAVGSAMGLLAGVIILLPVHLLLRIVSR